jgi:hypothetical protein
MRMTCSTSTWRWPLSRCGGQRRWNCVWTAHGALPAHWVTHPVPPAAPPTRTLDDLLKCRSLPCLASKMLHVLWSPDAVQRTRTSEMQRRLLSRPVVGLPAAGGAPPDRSHPRAHVPASAGAGAAHAVLPADAVGACSAVHCPLLFFPGASGHPGRVPFAARPGSWSPSAVLSGCACPASRVVVAVAGCLSRSPPPPLLPGPCRACAWEPASQSQVVWAAPLCLLVLLALSVKLRSITLRSMHLVHDFLEQRHKERQLEGHGHGHGPLPPFPAAHQNGEQRHLPAIHPLVNSKKGERFPPDVHARLGMVAYGATLGACCGVLTHLLLTSRRRFCGKGRARDPGCATV